MADRWTVAEPDLESVLRQVPKPLDALAEGRIPAVVLRGAYSRNACQSLVQRLVDDQLLFDPQQPVPEKFAAQAIPEGYYREGRGAMRSFPVAETSSANRTRIDVGTSLGYRGSDKRAFLEHAESTHQLFAHLFRGLDDPIRLVYEQLESLAGGKRVVTAHEPDGRKYGPAIIRAHYGGYTYKPHFDSVRLREKRAEYAVHRFAHQFAGVLVLQNATREGRSAQGILHHCLWQPEIDSHLKQGAFHEYARRQHIDRAEICLEPGDLYFFNTRLIHEVPGVAGRLPRIVLATFIGYDPNEPEVFVWS